MIRRAIKVLKYLTSVSLKSLGFELVRLKKGAADHNLIADGFSSSILPKFDAFMEIPGMLSKERGAYLYLMAYSSTVEGDVVELGSWQGRSTCFLAQACKDSNRGIVHAVDTFKGNPQKEHCYVVNSGDLSDLEGNFKLNIERAGLSRFVKLYAMDVGTAFPMIKEDVSAIRLLFVDTNHTYDEVIRCVSTYRSLLVSGSLIVFDDYSKTFPDVVKAVADLRKQGGFDSFVQYENTCVMRRV